MPKLNPLQIADRLQKQLDKLLADEEVAIRDLRALLTDEQNAEMDVAWQQQQALRKQTKARTEEKQRALGWLTKREVQIAAVEKALAGYKDNELEELKKLLKDKEVRQSKIFLREFFCAIEGGKEFWSAWSWANNELVRAGLQRIDGQPTTVGTARDREVGEMEEQIRERIRSEMTAEEREQDEILREWKKKRNKEQSK